MSPVYANCHSVDYLSVLPSLQTSVSSVAFCKHQVSGHTAAGQTSWLCEARRTELRGINRHLDARLP